MPYIIHIYALTGEKLCINGFHALLKHGKVTFNTCMIVPGPLKLFRQTPFIGHHTKNWWCATYVYITGPYKVDPLFNKEKMLGPGLEPRSHG